MKKLIMLTGLALVWGSWGATVTVVAPQEGAATAVTVGVWRRSDRAVKGNGELWMVVCRLVWVIR